jgi:hypothetical protein
LRDEEHKEMKKSEEGNNYPVRYIRVHSELGEDGGVIEIDVRADGQGIEEIYTLFSWVVDRISKTIDLRSENTGYQ